jgi:hypothetical protein
VLAGACSTFSSSDLVIDRVDPPSGPNTAAVAVQVDGAGFHVPITSSLDGTSTTVGTMTVTIGETVLADASRLSDQTLAGTVPAGLAIGAYDVTVTIGDRTAVLPGGYTVTGAFAPLHLANGDGMVGSATLTLSGAVTIDTSAPSISVALPSGDTFDVRPQLAGGTDLAVLHVDGLVVTTGAIVTITGSRPLVIVAGGDVTIAGTLDAGAHGVTPGPGGAAPGLGSGAGTQGQHDAGTDSDTGGGGAGYGGGGAAGGVMSGCTVTLNPGGGGPGYGDDPITLLAGGSGGGPASGTSCLPVDPGGAGGGALQISSQTQIDISGQINAGGGGGTGGTDCGQADVNSGAGGGAGGAVVLQAPAITSTGTIAANGGGGGGSSVTNMGSGQPGQDGQLGATAALGGTGPVAVGGNGGVVGTAPTTGNVAPCGENASGGGGSVGRIAASAGFAPTGVTSPTPNTTLPP